jgi:Flp pilus assembly protein TadD
VEQVVDWGTKCRHAGRHRFIVRKSIFAATLLIAVGTFSHQAQASDVSDRLVARGLVQLKAGQFIAATKYFNGAVQLDSKDPRALFYLGVELNRIGQHGAALESFQRMWSLKVTNSQLGLEGGWAAIAQGRTALAITMLEPYVKANPKNAKAREFLGRAYIGDGRLEDAERELKRAIELDPALKPTALYYLGNIAALRRDTKGVATALTSILKENPDSRTGNVLRDTLRRAATAPQPERKPWFASLSVSGGENSNVIGLPDEAVLPADVSSRTSKFFRTQLDVGYNWRLDDVSSLTAGYGFTHERYSGVAGFDSMSNSAYLDYRRKVTDRIEGGLRVSHSISATDGETSVQRTTVSPSTTYRWSKTDATSLRYSVAPTSYAADPARKVLDRDGISHVVTLSHGTLVDGPILPIGVNLQVGLSRNFNKAEGDDYDYSGYGGFISASRMFPLQIRGAITFSHQRDEYNNLNSLAGAGFAFHREDKIDRLNLFLERPLTVFNVENATVFVNWQYLNNRSTLSFFNYEQTSFNLRITARF